MAIKTEARFSERWNRYPTSIKPQMDHLRRLVHEVVHENDWSVNETLKWGEPSFITKHGSTLRMDWKEKSPNQYALYFSCSTILVETFKQVFGPQLKYEGKRAIIFGIENEVPEPIIKQCIKACLIYHKVKGLPLLGM